jgi:hypothetical protein
VSLYAFDGGPRDLRFSSQKNKLVRQPAQDSQFVVSSFSAHRFHTFRISLGAQKEAGWDNSRPSRGHYIPEYGTPGTHACVGQIEEHVKRPVTVAGWRSRDHRKKESPTLFVNSMTWNRRHCA